MIVHCFWLHLFIWREFNARDIGYSGNEMYRFHVGCFCCLVVRGFCCLVVVRGLCCLCGGERLLLSVPTEVSVIAIQARVYLERSDLGLSLWLRGDEAEHAIIAAPTHATIALIHVNDDRKPHVSQHKSRAVSFARQILGQARSSPLRCQTRKIRLLEHLNFQVEDLNLSLKLFRHGSLFS